MSHAEQLDTGAGLLHKGQEAAEDFIRRGVDTWEAEGHIDAARSQALMATLNAPEVELGMLHLGAHFAISLPLRFPLGAGARFLYTLGLRVRAEVGALLGRGSAREARRMHTWLVMLVSLMPGFGRLGYFFSPALREERLLLFIPLDQVSRRLPLRVYSRLHLDALFLYWGLGDEHETRWRLPLPTLSGLHERAAALKPYLKPVVAVLALDTALLLGSGYVYVNAEEPREAVWWWKEGSLISIMDSLQLLAAAGFGMAAYTTFWRRRRQGSRGEAAGIFLWAIGSIGLTLFALDDYFTVHERLGDRVFGTVSFLPVVTHLPGDMLVLIYALAGIGVIALFRQEVLSRRASATLLQLAAAASIVMVLSDGFANSEATKALEFPAQTFACSLLMLAFLVRYLEVRQAPPVATGRAGARGTGA